MTRLWRSRLVVTSPALVMGLLALAHPGDDGPTVCPFALLTGVACPGCGMTRAAAALVRGDLTTAVGYHPMVIVFAVLGMGAWVWYLLRRSGRAGPIPPRLVNVVLIGTGVMLLGVWAARAATGTLPPV
jgi:hypothetical protein